MAYIAFQALLPVNQFRESQCAFKIQSSVCLATRSPAETHTFVNISWKTPYSPNQNDLRYNSRSSFKVKLRFLPAHICRFQVDFGLNVSQKHNLQKITILNSPNQNCVELRPLSIILRNFLRSSFPGSCCSPNQNALRCALHCYSFLSFLEEPYKDIKIPFTWNQKSCLLNEKSLPCVFF